MPKLKTVKGVKDRIKVTGTGKLVGFRPGRRHLLGTRPAKIKRKLRKQRVLSRPDERQVRSLIPYM
ncbi:MAG: 50S ribosomal protein L35 [Candidatus Omnitrophica bacterium]|nr:50S ribosomal protein L35 [Candidatus Omnitrophota bacterium]